MVELKNMNELDEEIYVAAWSRAIGLTFGDLQRQFGVRILHYHESPISTKTKREATPDIKIQPGMYFTVKGPPDKIEEVARYVDVPYLKEAISSMNDHVHVLSHPDRVDLAVILAYIHHTPWVDVDYVSRVQKKLDLTLSKRRIKRILDEWTRYGYAELSRRGKYRRTRKLLDALGRINVTEERLIQLSKLNYP
jgi:hypothetical protein